MNRLFAILTAFALVLGLTACGQTEARSSPGQSRQEGAFSAPSGDQSAPPASALPENSETEAPKEGGVLVAYFSATGNTENVALHLQNILGADLYEILPEIPYTDEDLDHSGDGCRANREQNDPAARPAITGTPENPEDYDVVFLGYPIWWGQAPKVLYTFLENCDFGGAVLVPFCTSGSSGIGSSTDGLRALTEDARWVDGRRFSAGAGEDEVAQWVEGLELLSAMEGEFEVTVSVAA